MKKKMIKLLFLGAVLFGASTSVSAQIYVRIRPVVPIIVRAPQPSPAHVWIDEEWEPNGNEYRYGGGRWESPPHHGYNYRQGYWKRHHDNGEVWVHGGWRK